MKQFAKNQLGTFNLEQDLRVVWGNLSQSDIPRLRQGRVGAQVSNERHQFSSVLSGSVKDFGR